ncbi:YcaO-like family protein [Nakamurella flavida]|uniref:YcaO-like family protein n=1 Tax=Nakamurella flavida TaxID=363630 RepID=A0A938YC91_9ACTN|nr:YcaO-like family protein [Nakamurella flavida]MBM9475010.1 YcaO-like family protein [Nakamurella flavida]MDP9776579.1 ribosomal protein S12 methylthiotransferase accessory factor [Nakamurella flavida]
MTVADAITAYRAALQPVGEVVSFPLSALDRTGVPVTSCSLVDRSTGTVGHHGNGYGLTDEAAEVSGLGELAEGVLTGHGVSALRDRAVRLSFRELVAAQGVDRVADPLTLCLPAGSPYTSDMSLTWLPMERVRSGDTVWVPQEFVVNGPGELTDGVTAGTALVTPITNGLGAGSDRARALAHGLGEILQRHTNGLRFRALDSRSPVIDPAGLPPRVAALVDRLRAVGVEPVLKHAGTELGVVSTYAMGRDDSPDSRIMLTACGEAAHPDAETSLLKALLEYANSRARKAFCFGPRQAAMDLAPAAYRDGLDPSGGEPRAVAAMRAWADLSTDDLRALTEPDVGRTVGYDSIRLDLPPLPDQQALLDHLLSALAGHDVLATTVAVDGVVAVKVLVPGLEVETLSYGRIGEANARAALAADLDLVRVQPGPSGTHTERVLLTPQAQERLGGPVWWSRAVRDAIVGPRYPLYREPPRHSVEV